MSLIKFKSNRNEYAANLYSLTIERHNEEYPSFIASTEIPDYQELVKDIHFILHPDEIKYFNQLTYPKRKKSYLAGRYVAKIALSAHLDEIDFTNICIDIGIFGQPIVRYPGITIPEISISHSRDFAYAITFPLGHQIGIDVEHITKEEDKLDSIKSLLTPAEKNYLFISAFEPHITYTILWTMKEALSKILRCGLSASFNTLEISKPIFRKDEILCLYKNFEQYKSQAFILDDHVLSITSPRYSTLIATDLLL